MKIQSQKFLKKDIEKLKEVGFDILEEKRIGSFIQVDNKFNYSKSKVDDIEIIPTSQALKKYPWAKNYLWKVVDKNKDKFTREVARFPQEGYFIRVKKNKKVKIPVQACLYIKKKNLKQRVHNLIIAEEGSSIDIITGCTISPHIFSGTHIGISEFFVKKGASISFTMIHNWAKDTIVRPRSAAIVEKDGRFVSNYICLKDVKDIQMYPMAYLKGEGAVCYFNSVLVAPEKSLLDIGSGISLEAPMTRGEITVRAVSYGGEVVSRGKLVGNFSKTKAHLECYGLVLNKNGKINAIPEIEAKTMETELSHEAAIGKIKEEEIEYLMARGIPRKKAISMIVKGFLGLEDGGIIPDEIKNEIDSLILSPQERVKKSKI